MGTNTKTEAIDKSKWGRGPWQNEPDRIEYEHLGFPCLIVRVDHSGHLCGYVAVPPGHPWHGADYNDVSADVHGGLTYGDTCAGRICHVPKPGEPDNVFWLGFDCGHCDDMSPAYPRHLKRGIYRTVSYVRSEIESLAAQAKAAGSL